MPNTSKKEIAALKKDIDSLKSNVVELTKTLRKDAVAQASTNITQLKNKGQHALEAVGENVKTHPGQSVLYAFLGGLVASSFLKRQG